MRCGFSTIRTIELTVRKITQRAENIRRYNRIKTASTPRGPVCKGFVEFKKIISRSKQATGVAYISPRLRLRLRSFIDFSVNDYYKKKQKREIRPLCMTYMALPAS